MRNMSFMLTVEQMLNRTKTVTRRDGWWFLESGDVVMACVKCMGLKKGEKVKKLYPIIIISSTPEILAHITQEDCIKEGFPHYSPLQFTKMFCKHNKCEASEIINRIEFKEVKL